MQDADKKPAPRWIGEALTMATARHMLADSEESAGLLATALLERIPIIGMQLRAVEVISEHVGGTARDMARDVVTALVSVLTDADSDVVTLTELYQNAARALDDAGVPYAAAPSGATDIDSRIDAVASGAENTHLDLTARIRWLAGQRPRRFYLQRVEAERDQAVADRDMWERAHDKQRDDANAWATRCKELGDERDRITDAADVTHDLLTTQIAECNTMIAELRGEVEAHEVDIAELEGQIYSDADAERDPRDARIAELEDENERLTNEVSDLEDQVDEMANRDPEGRAP